MPKNATPLLRMLSVAVTMAQVSQAQAQSPLTDPRMAADAMASAVAAQDAGAIAALYLPEAVVLGPGLPPVAGQAAIREVWVRNFASGFRSLSFTDIRAEGGQDRAAVMWTWTAEIAPAGQPAQVVRGRSLVYFALTADGWRISADMWHPAP
jgi:uncharacterized protein (TIGR02246 family)